jgi:hypothetical protein
VDKDLANRQAALAGDPERAGVVAAARRFKASWFELGEALTRVRREERWKAYGYSSFEDYCKRELHLRQETADKLTGSYSFLHSRAPKVVERAFARDNFEEEPLPAYQAVDFWRRADEGEADRETVEEIGRQVLDGASFSKINKQFREVVFPLDEETQREKRRAELRTLTAKITELLALARDEGLVPATLSAELEEPLQRLAVLVARTPRTHVS